MFALFEKEKNRIGKVDVTLCCYGEDRAVFPVEYSVCRRGAVVRAEGRGQQIRDTLTLTRRGAGYVATRRFQNIGKEPIRLKELCLTANGLDFGGAAEDDYFYSNENPRIYGTFTLPLDYDRAAAACTDKVRTDTRWADPETVGGRIGASPYQPFPALLVSNYDCSCGLVHGSLSQDVFYHNYEAGHAGNGAFLKVFSSFKSIAYRIVRPGETLTDRWYLGLTERADDINEIFSEYTSRLRSVLHREKRSVCGRAFVWGSWNDGVYRDVSEDLLLEQAERLKKYFPQIKWLQLDDGYSSFCEADPDRAAHGIGTAYEGEAGTDRKKFPEGLRGFAQKVKARGLHPALWVGGLCPRQTKIVKEHPDWFIDYSYRIPDSMPMDVSLPEVRQYLRFALDEFLVKDGLEGIKHDFWSYAFEDSHDLLKNKDKSGYEYRKWWLHEIRKRLPVYGYMESGCDIGLGNPFLGEYFDNYRYGLDVGAGDWNKVRTTMFWGTACISTRVSDLILPNSDAVGLMKGLCDADFMFLLNYALATGSLVELSGIYDEQSDSRRIALLQKATAMARNGIDVRYIKFDYRRQGMVLPEILFSDSAEVCGKEVVGRVALFNAEERPKEISFTAEEIGVPPECELVDGWTGEKSVFSGRCSRFLSAHGSKLYFLKKK